MQPSKEFRFFLKKSKKKDDCFGVLGYPFSSPISNHPWLESQSSFWRLAKTKSLIDQTSSSPFELEHFFSLSLTCTLELRILSFFTVTFNINLVV